MKFFVVRHSVPKEVETDSFLSDDDADDPPLTDEGKKIVEALADWMRDADEMPSILIASPMQRTQETAAILRDKLDVLPKVVTDPTIGPHASIRGLILRATADKSMVRVGIVSHHESIEHGLRVLGLNPFVHLDMFAQGELRIFHIDRETGEWDEHLRMQPSDFGLTDHY